MVCSSLNYYSPTLNPCPNYATLAGSPDLTGDAAGVAQFVTSVYNESTVDIVLLVFLGIAFVLILIAPLIQPEDRPEFKRPDKRPPKKTWW